MTQLRGQSAISAKPKVAPISASICAPLLRILVDAWMGPYLEHQVRRHDSLCRKRIKRIAIIYQPVHFHHRFIPYNALVILKEFATIGACRKLL